MDPSVGQAPDLTVDDKAKSSFVRWFTELEKQDETEGPQCMRFFDNKSCYSVHGESALFVAREYYKTTAVVKYIGGPPSTGLTTVTLNRALFERVVRDLLVVRGEHLVELYEGGGASWQRTKSASPGRVGAFEDVLARGDDAGEAALVMAVTVAALDGARTVGVAVLDASARTIAAAQFADDDRFCTLEAVVTQLAPKECVIVKEAPGSGGGGEGGGGGSARVAAVLERCGVLAVPRDRAVFSDKAVEQDLARLLRGSSAEQHRDVLERPLTRPAIAAVVAFAEVMADKGAHGRYALSLYDPGRYMRLDAAAQRALNVLKGKGDINDTFSLLGLLSKGRTQMGRRLCKVWLKQPLVDVAAISERHDVVEALAADTELRDRLRDQSLRGMPDVERLTRKLERRKTTLADLCQLYRASSKLPAIAAALRAHEGPHAQLLSDRYAGPLEAAHGDEKLLMFEQLLEAAVDLDRVPDEYLIAAAYDPQLEELAGDKTTAEEAIDSAAANVERHLGLELGKTLKLEWYRAANTRIRCLRITSKEEKAVRGKMQGGKYETLETRKDGIKFTCSSLRSAATQLQSLTTKYDTCQAALVQQVVGIAATYVEVWEEVTALLGELDVLAGFAELAACAPTPYVRPTVLPADQGELILRGCRHPNVEAQEGVEFIPNHCVMQRGKSWFHIITGPNMGGKSTYIRQVGVCVLMAQVGCWVPCSEARIAVRDAIFARVGAGDCQARGVSTFMAEMLETAAILKGASSRSLVIIDELGRGTSTYDGFGLAWAIGEHLMQEIGAPVLFATHFHELTALTGPTGVYNQHVQTAIDDTTGKLTMLYQVAPGPCDQSFGIHVAEFAKFPPEVVADAKRKAAQLEAHPDAAALAADAAGQDGGEGVPAAKKRRGDDDSAAAAVRIFLRNFAALPLDAQPVESAARAQALFGEFMQEARVFPQLAALLEQSA